MIHRQVYWIYTDKKNTSKSTSNFQPNTSYKGMVLLNSGFCDYSLCCCLFCEMFYSV